MLWDGKGILGLCSLQYLAPVLGFALPVQLQVAGSDSAENHMSA
jgi:hypothetical protein